MKYTFLQICLLLFIFPDTKSQFKEPKFGEIEINHLTQTHFPNDSNASAAYLFDYGMAYFNINPSREFEYIYERHCRIKIYNKSALDLGNFFIRLSINNNSKEEVQNFKGATFNLVDGKMVKSKLEKESIFTTTEKNYSEIKYVFPDVKEGSIIEFSFAIKSDFLYNFRGWRFQRNYPIVWSQYTFQIPEYFDYRLSTKGYLGFDIDISEQKEQSFNLHYESEITPGIGGGRTSTENYTVRAKSNVRTLAVKNVPAFKSEPNIDCEDNYLQSIEFELSSIQFPNDIRKDYTNSWESVNKQLNYDEDFGILLNSDGFVKDTVTMICIGKTTDIEKASAIYTYMQNTMRWNGIHSLWAFGGLKKPLSVRMGNSAEINLLLTLMLRTAGLTSYPVLFSTRENGYPITIFPTITKFNSVMSSVLIDGKTILMDATNDFCPFGIIPSENINSKGRLINDGSGDWVDLTSNEKHREVKCYNIQLKPDGEMDGVIVDNYAGYAAINLRNILNSKSNNDIYYKDLEKNIPGLTINRFSVENQFDKSKSLTDSLFVVITDRTDLIGDKILFKPMLFESIEKNRYTLEERKYPVDYNYPISETYLFEYSIPEGYQVESLPKPTSMKMPDNSITLSYLIQQEGNKIKLIYKRNINKFMFLPEEYKGLKEFYDLMVSKHNELVILKKL